MYVHAIFWVGDRLNSYVGQSIAWLGYGMGLCLRVLNEPYLPYYQRNAVAII